MGNIIMPKNNATVELVIGVLQIYADAGDWLSNADFIAIYIQRFGQIGDGRDKSAYTAKTEIGAYYGFIEWEDINNARSMRRITSRGKQFLDHYNTGDTAAYHEDIMCSLEELHFGRNNFACQSSDSDIEPPPLFFRAAIDLGQVTKPEFGYLLYKMEYSSQGYTDTIQEIKTLREQNRSIEVPTEHQKIHDKLTDAKAILILERWGILIPSSNGITINPDFLQNMNRE